MFCLNLAKVDFESLTYIITSKKINFLINAFFLCVFEFAYHSYKLTFGYLALMSHRDLGSLPLICYVTEP